MGGISHKIGNPLASSQLRRIRVMVDCCLREKGMREAIMATLLRGCRFCGGMSLPTCATPKCRKKGALRVCHMWHWNQAVGWALMGGASAKWYGAV